MRLKRGWAVDPHDAGDRFAGVAIAVRQFRAKIERVTGLESLGRLTHGQLELAFQDIADLFANVLDFAAVCRAGSDHVDVAFEQLALGMRRQALEADRVPFLGIFDNDDWMIVGPVEGDARVS